MSLVLSGEDEAPRVREKRWCLVSDETKEEKHTPNKLEVKL
jgi:hypothetical protein